MSASTTHVISICHLQHESVWRLTAELLLRHVEGDRFSVFVPADEVESFREITPPEIAVRSQLDLDAGFVGPLRSAAMDAENPERFGWYLQQFYKLEALRLSESARSVIWDADCVPLRRIELFDSDGIPRFMHATEFRQEYFAVIEKFLGLTRVQTQSFIVPGFPIFREWVLEFFAFVEERYPNQTWHEALISCIDFSSRSGFSETETLGTWIANSHPLDWKTSQYIWERGGQGRFGFARELDSDLLVQIGQLFNLDIVTFENWDRLRFSKLASRRLLVFSLRLLNWLRRSLRSLVR